jgi:hypothetical protein
MNVTELKNYLNAECNNVLSVFENTTVSESEFKNYLKLPLNNFNDKFKGLKITEKDNEKIKENVKNIMEKYINKLTELYFAQGL